MVRLNAYRSRFKENAADIGSRADILYTTTTRYNKIDIGDFLKCGFKWFVASHSFSMYHVRRFYWPIQKHEGVGSMLELLRTTKKSG